MGVMYARVANSWVPIGNGGVNSIGGSGIIKVDVTNPGTPVVSTQAGTTPGPLTVAGSTTTSDNLVLGVGYTPDAMQGGRIRLNGAVPFSIDSYNSTMRLFRDGLVAVTVYSDGGVNITGGLTVGGRVTAATDFYLSGNGSYYFSTWGGGWYMSDSTWIRSNNSKGVWLGAGWFGCDGGITLGYGGGLDGTFKVYCNGHGLFWNINCRQIDCDSVNTRAGQRVISNGGTGGGWGNLSMLAQLSSSAAGYAIHPGGVARGIGCVPNNGTTHLWNEDAGWYGDFYCNQVGQASQRRGKQDIVSWPPKSAGAAVMGASSRLSLIDVVSYRLRPEMALLQAESLEEEGQWRVHDCDTDDCDGTSDEPCVRVREWDNPSLGVIIEDLATVLPEAVGLAPDGTPGAMRLGSMIGFLVAVCQEQQERIEALEGERHAA